ncbi:GerMN domain-containing protein [Streptomyces sp. NPDC059447]|uniref:GerMN domain-containing protein n=1 Tax=Streptomyces sp. NPDC059447 TaxID=3346834 RepID=UPI0036B56CCC
MTRVRAAAAATALLGPLLLAGLAGCGIKPTGPVDSGSAATVLVAGPEGFSMLYFLGPDGRLVPSPQRDVPKVPPVELLNRLLDGPGQREREAGLTSEVPSLHGKRVDVPAISSTSPDVMTVQLPFDVEDLTPNARLQLVCTLGSTAAKGVRLTVAVKGSYGTLGAIGCDGRQ